MALRPTKKKPVKKKNPYRLSSDRQPGIAKANERKPRRRNFPKYIEEYFKKQAPKMVPLMPKTYKDLLKKMPKKGLKGLQKATKRK